MKTKFPVTELILLIIIFVLALLAGCKVPQSSVTNVVRYDTIRYHCDTLVQGGEAMYEYHTIDTLYVEVPCPEKIVYITRKMKTKVKDSYNYIGEINTLKKSNQIKDSVIDSLNMQLGKKCVGTQTNNGSKWWIFVLLGMAIGIAGYQGIRSAITKKI